MRLFTPSPEPWKRGVDGLIWDAEDEYVTDTCGTSLPNGEENQKRIVACVNAMQGIADPEQFMRQLRNACAIAEGALRLLESDRSTLTDDQRSILRAQCFESILAQMKLT